MWGKLTDNDLDRISGHVDQLVGIVQERYGYTKEQAEKEVAKFMEQLKQWLWYGDRHSGRSWMDENDVYGTIGRSGGTIRIPLICPPRSSSGSGLLDGSIVRIDDVIARKTLWAHRKFHLPETVLQAISPPMETDGQRYVVEALVEGKTHARFGSWDEAGHWLAMQSGRCLDNPGTDD